MDYILIGLVAMAASMLTLVTGFGLGTLLLPAFAAFFPVELAVAMTAIVHLAHNLFKLALVGRHADKQVVASFGVPALLAALVGAWLLLLLDQLQPLAQYQFSFAGNQYLKRPTLVKVVIGSIMILFALVEIIPALKRLQFDRRLLPLGGVISGFLGGLSGHQGAPRAAFLARAGLSPQQFVGTGAAIACLVDLSRLGVYSGDFRKQGLGANAWLIAAACLCALLGVYIGSSLLHKITILFIQRLVALGLIVIGALMIVGLI